jgi:hypothetical protein
MERNLEIKNEEILLTHLCRLNFTQEQKQKLREIAEGISSWNYFSLLANKHGISALVYHNLNTLGLLSFLPDENTAFLKNALLRNITRNVSLYNSLEKTLEILNRENIKTVLLKGIALEILIYENCGLRLMSDADVFISKEDSIKAYNILLNAGFKAIPQKSFLHRLIIPYIGKHLPTLIRNEFAFEIHHNLFGSDNILNTNILASCSEITITNQKFYIPTPRYLFLYGVKHIHVHELSNESQLKSYADLVILLDKYYDEILTPDLINDAARADISDILAFKLYILKEFWGFSYPLPVSEYVAKFQCNDLNEKFNFFLKSPVNNESDKVENYKFNIRSIPGFHRKILYVIGDLFPSASFMKKRYGLKSSLSLPLYYTHRFGKLFWLLKKFR